LGYFIAFICFLLAAIAYLIEGGRLYNPSTLMLGWWGIIVLAGSMQLFGLYAISDKAWTIILVGLLSFWAGGLISRAKTAKVVAACRNYETKKTLNGSLANLAIAILLIYNIIMSYNAIGLYIQGYSMGDVRAEFFGVGDSILGGSIFYLIGVYITSPLFMCIVPIMIVKFVRGDNRKTAVIILFILLAFRMIVTGGRFELLYAIVEMVICLLIYIKISKMIKKQIRHLIVIAVIAIIYLTITRLGTSNIFEHFYVYLCGCLPFFNSVMKNINFSTNGFASLSGFFSVVFFTLDKFGVPYPSEYLTSGALMNIQGYKNITDTIQINAFGTTFLYPFMDFGMEGVVLFMSIYGYICYSVYRKVVKDKSDYRYVAIYLILAKTIFNSMQMYIFSDTSTVLAIVFCLILFGKKEKVAKLDNYNTDINWQENLQ
jgi:oligosaccharide repeat unit polymerase